MEQPPVVINHQKTVGTDWPYQSVRRFAELNGLTMPAVYSRIQRGTLPIRPKVKKGDKCLINVAMLERQALEQQF